MDYDLIRLFEHEQLCLFEFIPSTIVTFGAEGTNQCGIQVEWRRSAGEPLTEAELTLKWDIEALRVRNPLIDRQIQARQEWDDDQATRTEEAAIVVAVAVLSHIEPETKFTRRSTTWTYHDYYLNGTRDEMIEVGGEWTGGLPKLFEKKRKQSDRNVVLRKRWVSVTIIRESPRNRTEGMHS